jgi:hypothetical protein
MRYALFFFRGEWVATCRTCGGELARMRSRASTERAAVQSCPFCW